jgi:hypothetical protein
LQQVQAGCDIFSKERFEIMQKKNVALREGESLFGRGAISSNARDLNAALAELPELQVFYRTFRHADLPPRERSLAELDAPISLLHKTRQLLAGEDLAVLLKQVPAVTQRYLQASLGVPWEQAIQQLTTDNINQAIQQLEKQKTQLTIITERKNRKAVYQAEFTALPKDFYAGLDAQVQSDYQNKEVNNAALLEYVRKLLPEQHQAGQRYFIKLTPELKAILHAENLPVVAYAQAEYLVIADKAERELLEQKIYGLCLDKYENILLSQVLKYDQPGNKGVSGQEISDMLIGQSASGIGETDFYNQSKLFGELAVLELNYADPVSGALNDDSLTWQRWQKETNKNLDFYKTMLNKKYHAAVDKKIAEDLSAYAEKYGLKTKTLPASTERIRRPRTQREPLKINLEPLKDALGSLPHDKRFKTVLLLILGLLALGGGGFVINKLLGGWLADKEQDNFFTRAKKKIQEIFDGAVDKLASIFSDDNKSAQEVRDESTRVIQETRRQIDDTLQQPETASLPPEKRAELQTDANRTDDLQKITDIYTEARQKYEDTIRSDYDKIRYTKTQDALDEAAAAINGPEGIVNDMNTVVDTETGTTTEKPKYPPDDNIRALADMLAGDLEDKRQKIQDIIDEQERLAEEKARQDAEAAERASRAAQAAQQAQELEKTIEATLRLCNKMKSAIRSAALNEALFRTTEDGKGGWNHKAVYNEAVDCNDFARNPTAYFAAKGKYSASDKIQETKRLADVLNNRFAERVSDEASTGN